MGEIKSTLDLVMEKTRHLTLSKEERDAQHSVELRRGIRGLIQKYIDGLLGKDQFNKEFNKLNKVENRGNEPVLQEVILDRIRLDAANQEPLLELLEFYCRVDVAPLAAILREFADRRNALRETRMDERKEWLQKELNISGSAVVPNLETDAGFMEDSVHLKDTFRARLKKEKERLLKRAV